MRQLDTKWTAADGGMVLECPKSVRSAWLKKDIRMMSS